MKKIIYSLSLALVALFAACDGYKDASDAEKVEPLNVPVGVTIQMDNIQSVSDLKVKLDDYADNYHYLKEVSGTNIDISDVLPGIYTVSVSGTGYDAEGTEYYLNGNLVNVAIYKGSNPLNVSLSGLKVSPLIFKEIYYAGSKPPVGFAYFRDQFYEIYNNSSTVQYLDGVYFANLTPSKSTKNLPIWDGGTDETVCYAERVWRFPGSGHDYPLQPGESAVIAQLGVNHQLEIYNPNSPVDCSHAEFEFYMNSRNFSDQPAINMEHVFYRGKAEIGSLQQYLTSVFGPGIVLFRVPEGEKWDPVNDATYQAHEVNKSTLYAKIPIRYILDGVECIDNENSADAKRMPAAIDAGMTWVGSTYCGLGVVRKVQLTESGDTLKRDNGALIFQDTNNSTDDFERGVIPVLHRYGTGVPSWNVTY